MSDYKTFELTRNQLNRLNFETTVDSLISSDIDDEFHLEEMGYNIYQQFVYDDNSNKLKVGIHLKTVGELMARYKSFTGYDLQYWDKPYPQTGQ